MKDAVGDLIDNEDLEDEGERENEAGKDRQKKERRRLIFSQEEGAARPRPLPLYFPSWV